jgi:acyl-CoA thioester hydrolase
MRVDHFDPRRHHAGQREVDFMPAIYERAFRIRYHECDAYGHVNHANYLRYMQEAAFDASAAVGYDFGDYARMNRYWLVRESHITFFRPLKYGDTVVVKTWVADFRRVRSNRRYELTLAGTGEAVAEATSDWVFLDATNQHPARIPAAMIEAFWPDGRETESGEHHAFPKPPDPPAGIHRSRRVVQWGDIDGAHHVNNAVYLTYLEDCAVEFVRQHGWPVERMMRSGFGIVARNFQILYERPAVMDDELEVATWVSDVKRVSAVRHYTIHRVADGQLMLRARALWVWVNLTRGRPMRIPDDFLDDLSANIVGDMA